jgi:hypothetical protein
VAQVNRHLTSATSNNSTTVPAGVSAIEVINRSAQEVYFTLDGTAAVVGAPNTFVLPAVIGYVKAINLAGVETADVVAGRQPVPINYIGSAVGSFSIEY